MRNATIRGLSGLFLAVLLTSSCSKDPEKQKLEHVARGDQYAAEKRDEFAVVEYASAVKLDPKFGEARLKLAQTYERLNNLRAAIPQQYVTQPSKCYEQNKLSRLMMMIRMLQPIAESGVIKLIRDQMLKILNNDDTAILGLGLIGALWSSSAAMGAIVNAMNRAYDIEEASAVVRSVLRSSPIGLTLGLAGLRPAWRSTLVMVGPTLRRSPPRRDAVRAGRGCVGVDLEGCCSGRSSFGSIAGGRCGGHLLLRAGRGAGLGLDHAGCGSRRRCCGYRDRSRFKLYVATSPTTTHATAPSAASSSLLLVVLHLRARDADRR